MTLVAGTKLGPYTIVGPLGAGGMGEVYRAKDTRLGREVAIKVLPQHLSANPEVRARFEREAKTVSSLNHPNICTLFDVGREGETDYLVMELVDGESLAQRLAKGALPVGEVLRLGAQIADALDRAHRAGVIHRDLKPGNVMLMRSGAKLMDFGLARATGLSGAASGSGVTMAALTQSPTMADPAPLGAPLTAEGTLVGTFQYMSPEQLEGREADARSDLWALGCVLYEMATGRRAFDGKSQASLISAIMSGEPVPISNVTPASGASAVGPPPAALDRIVRQCLAKDPDDRWQAAGDLRRELEWIASQGSQASVPRPEAPGARRAPRGPLFAWAIVATVAAAMLVFVHPGVRQAPGGAAILTLPMPRGIALSVDPFDVAVSPDGRHVAFVATDSSGVGNLCVRALDETEPHVVPETETANHPFWSPDSRWIGYFTKDDHPQLKKWPLSGGAPITLCDVEWSRGGTWSRKGDILFSPMPQGPVFRIAENGGVKTQVTQLDTTRGETSHRQPAFLPDGEHFVFSALPASPDGFPLFVGSLHSKAVKRIGFAGSAAVYAEPGYLLFQREKQLVAQRFDTRSLTLTGDVVPLGPAPAVSSEDATRIASVSVNGRLVVLNSAVPKRRMDVLDREGRVLGRVPMTPGDYMGPILSPDGRSMELADFRSPFAIGLVRVDLERGTLSRLADAAGYNYPGPWSRGGDSIAYLRSRDGREEIYVRSSEPGGGEPRWLKTVDGQFKGPEDWSADGRLLLFHAIRPRTSFDLLVLDVASGTVRVFSDSPGSEYPAAISPDGRWAEYDSDETGREEVFVRSFPDGANKVQATTAGCQNSAWSMDGRAIVFLGLDKRTMWTVPFTPGAPPVAGAARMLFRLPAATDVPYWTVSRSGDRFYFLVPDGDVPDPSLTVMMNWTALAGRR